LGSDPSARFAQEMIAFMESAMRRYPDNLNFSLLRRLFHDAPASKE
jgi:hypothetical protein